MKTADEFLEENVIAKGFARINYNIFDEYTLPKVIQAMEEYANQAVRQAIPIILAETKAGKRINWRTGKTVNPDKESMTSLEDSLIEKLGLTTPSNNQLTT